MLVFDFFLRFEFAPLFFLPCRMHGIAVCGVLNTNKKYCQFSINHILYQVPPSLILPNPPLGAMLIILVLVAGPEILRYGAKRLSKKVWRGRLLHQTRGDAFGGQKTGQQTDHLSTTEAFSEC